MATILPFDELALRPGVLRFDGFDRADVDVSFFYTEYQPGEGPRLHTHPYAEVFIVQTGDATYRAGDERIEVSGGNIVVVPPETPHGFKNTGSGTLIVIGIHPSGEIQQTDLE